MYEDMSFESIMKRALDRVPDDIDKREGSVIYDAVAPLVAELTQVYQQLDAILGLSFASTSSGEYLAKRAAEMGVERLLATKTVRKGLFYDGNGAPLDVPLGSRFSIESLYYTAIKKLALGEYEMECETAGAAGNSPRGDLVSIDYIDGLARAELTDVIVEGEDDETDERLLERYQLRVRKPATSGNVYQYQQWALEVPSVGGSKVFPIWNGPGTVKVVIVDTDRHPASPALVTETAQYIEKVRPIGATVTVVSAVGKGINVAAKVTLAQGYSLQSVVDAFTKAVGDYLKSVAFAMSYVSQAKIGTILLGVSGVLDYSNLTLNGSTANIALAAEEIPILGTLQLEV